jgi:hypothetical protein
MANRLFSQKEIDYLKSQQLARIATVANTSLEGKGSVQPDEVPVGFDYDVPSISNKQYLARRITLPSSH